MDTIHHVDAASFAAGASHAEEPSVSSDTQRLVGLIFLTLMLLFKAADI